MQMPGLIKEFPKPTQFNLNRGNRFLVWKETPLSLLLKPIIFRIPNIIPA